MLPLPPSERPVERAPTPGRPAWRGAPRLLSLALALSLSSACGSAGPGTSGATRASPVAGSDAVGGHEEPKEIAMNTDRPESDIDVVARFDAPEVARWSAFDDVIMGGVSASAMHVGANDRGVFAGEVSLENNGGFASVRSSPREWRLAGARGLALRVRGDGHVYKVNARTNDGTDGGSWQGAFETKRNEWITVRIPFEEFVPRFRGRTTDAGPLPAAGVRTLGLLITDKQAGPFRLEIEWIGAWR